MELDYPKIRRVILQAASPVTPIIGKIEIPAKRRLGDQDARAFDLAGLLPGTVLLSRKRLQLSNLFIPGEWKHAAIYCGAVGDEGVIEAVYPKTDRVDAADWVLHQDYVLALEPKFCGPHVMRHAADIALTLEGSDYDLAFESGAVNRAFYCAEVVWFAYEQALRKIGRESPFTPRLTMGVPTVCPDDFYLAEKLWRKAGFSRLREAA